MYQSTTNTLIWSGGGHHPSVVLVPGQPDRIVLTSEGPMMAVLRKAEFPAQSIQIPPETRPLIFSDGVFPLLAIWIFLLMCQSRRVTSVTGNITRESSRLDTRSGQRREITGYGSAVGHSSYI